MILTANPNLPVPGREQGIDGVIGHNHRLKASVSESGQLTTRGYPYAAICIGSQGLDEVVSKPLRVKYAEGGESDAVEASKPFLGSEPEVAITCLSDSGNGVLRKTDLGSQLRLNILAKQLFGVRRKRRGHEQDGDYEP